MISIWELANPQLREVAVYQPGKPIEETARELGLDPNAIVKLASNENPLGPSPKAMEAMRDALEKGHLYPDGGGFCLCNTVAAKLGVAPENVILGNGSNEVLEFLGHAFLNPGDDVIASEYAFIVYKLIATSFGARTIEVPGPDYQQDLEGMLGAITRKTRLIFVPNPNNPTGTLLSQKAIDHFMAHVPERVVAVFDEAYFEFLDDPPDTLRFVRDERNIVVLRTFSKIHGLAGLRIGYAVGPADLIEVLHKTRQPFNVNSIAQVGALAALQDDDHLRDCVAELERLVREPRNGLPGPVDLERLLELGRVELRLDRVARRDVGDGHAVFEKLLRQGIIVRPLKGYNLPEWVRISVGTMEENKKLIAALEEVMRCQ